MPFFKKNFDFLNAEEKISDYKKSRKYFTRKSPLLFPVVATSILHLFKESVEYNLQKVLPQLSTKPVTGSAFTQARYKIDPLFFKDLCELPAQLYNEQQKKRWKGHVLLACPIQFQLIYK